MYERILLPTDGSPGMGSTIDHCFHLAEQHDATVVALYVVDVRSYLMLPEETGGHVAELLEDDGRRALDSIRELGERHEIDIETELRTGVPHEVILEYADTNDVDLIVMGTHGRSGDQKRVLGSVAEEVVRRAEMPVLTVRMSEVDRQKVIEAVPEEQQRYIR